MCTAYTYPEVDFASYFNNQALYVDQAGLDMILVGDSVGMTDLVDLYLSFYKQGYSSTLPVNLEDTILFCKCVTRYVVNDGCKEQWCKISFSYW